MKSLLLKNSVNFYTIVNLTVCLVVFGLALIGIIGGVTYLRDTAIVLMPFIILTGYLSRKRKQLEEEEANTKKKNAK